jgi:SAM-dependent methyltransferase
MFWRRSVSEDTRRIYRDVRFPRDGDLIAFGPGAVATAQSYSVASAVHFDDLIFASIYMGPGHRDLDATAELYFRSGHLSAERIRNIAALHYVDRIGNGTLDRPLRLLDFASGYGCASRHVRNLMPAAVVTAADIHAAACDFHRDRLGISALLSALEPDRSQAQPNYDVVAALSFFSHLPKRRFVPWLRKLGEFVKPGGLLIFTANAAASHRLMPRVRLDRHGYGSLRDSEQFDIPLDYYLHAVTYPEFVHKAIDAAPGLELTMEFRSIWWAVQDAYVLRRH